MNSLISIAEEAKVLHVLTWFGTVLVTEYRTDFIAHHAIDRGDVEVPFLFLNGSKQKAPWETSFVKLYTAPRLLPSMLVRPIEHDICSFRCNLAPDFQSKLNCYMCAIPGGAIEVNRTDVAEWERFFLLDRREYHLLRSILYGAKFETLKGEMFEMKLGDGFWVQGGDHRFRLTNVLRSVALSLEQRTAEVDLEDSGGHIVNIRMSLVSSA